MAYYWTCPKCGANLDFEIKKNIIRLKSTGKFHKVLL